MKIYKPKSIKKDETPADIITDLLDNDLSIEDKLINLINSYPEIKLTSGAENLIIEKLITNLGGKIRFPRTGDNNERFDAVIDFNHYVCLVEIEIPSTAILDAPRNLLDDYAVAVSRRGFNDKPIIPLVICWDVPNKRQDYWNVIKDIKKILNIEIKTISIAALALHYWTSEPLNLQTDYYLDIDQQQMTTSISILNSHNIHSSTGTGYLEPLK